VAQALRLVPALRRLLATSEVEGGCAAGGRHPCHRGNLGVGTLLECANNGEPRGCVEDYSFEEASATLDLEVQDVERIYGALEGMGWIDRVGFTSMATTATLGSISRKSCSRFGARRLL
jgi:hypothetical protein